MKIILTLLFILIPGFVFGHGDKKHNETVYEDGWETVTKEISEEKLEKINFVYIEKIKPIFEKKCLDCHGNPKSYPFYYKVPGVKQLMNNDIREAKEHMDMSEDFPFEGHGSEKDDLESLKKTIKEETMPPWQYKLIHWNSSLNEEEKKVINNWIDESLTIIEKGK